MRILLPPSETKRDDGAGAPLDLEALSQPTLTATRRRLVRATMQVSARPRAAAKALELGPTQQHELTRNLALEHAPTMPAIECYTGVLYDALDVRGMSAAQRLRADERLLVASALFGLLAADDPIPAYRLSGGSRLPRIGSLAAVWKPRLQPVLERCAEEELLVDLRSGTYRTLAPVRRALTVRVLSQRPDGSRSVVSHFNKATKGRVARVLGTTAKRIDTVDATIAELERAGMQIERTADLSIDVIV